MTMTLVSGVTVVRSQWAVWMCGGVCVPLCKSHPASSLSYYLQDSGAKLVLVSPDLHPTVSDLVGVKMLVVEEDDVKDTDVNIDHDLVTPEASSAAMILYTSGTTGPPKGVILSHTNLHNQVTCLLEAWQWTSRDKILHVLPLHHTHGIVNCLMCPLTVGATVHMLPSFCPQTVWNILIQVMLYCILSQD